ncbi:hypothetical protein BVX99_02000, partial [bacterium F16]
MRKGPARRDREGVISEPYIGIFRTVQYTPALDQNVSMTVFDDAILQASGYQLPATFYYNQDERQSVRNLTNSSGAVVQSYDYTAYGDKIDSLTSGAVTQRYTYTGRESSDLSDSYYFRYRVYGAGLGGFLSRDPLGYIDGTSLYSGYFAMKMAMDPEGQQSVDDAIENGKKEKACNARLEKLKTEDKDIKRLREQIKARKIKGGKCSEPKTRCDCCDGSTRGGYIHGGKTTKPLIFMCWNREYTDTGFKETVYHEFTHAFDQCDTPAGIPPCIKSICTEIKAAARSGECDPPNGTSLQPGDTTYTCITRLA